MVNLGRSSPSWIKPPPALPKRSMTANKGSCGRVLILGGSSGMAGAPCLAARAAMRGGAGLVKTAVPKRIWDVVAIKLDESLTAGLSCNASGSVSEKAIPEIMELAHWADVVVLGPGMGIGKGVQQTIRKVVKKLDRTIVLDADGLNAFAHPLLKKLKRSKLKSRKRSLLLTPHPGEMARLLGCSVKEVQEDRTRAALECAALSDAVVVLKGYETLVTDGRRIFKNRTGNAGMASGGTGDVLAGLMGALIGQGMDSFEAACLSAHLHGLAGDLAAQKLGVWSLMAGDLVAHLPQAFIAHANVK